MVSEHRRMHLDPCFCGPLGLFYYVGTTWALSGNILPCFLGPLGPNLTLFLIYIFSLVSFVILFFLCFASDVKAAASRTFGVVLCEKFWLSAFNSRADNTVINYCKSFCKFKAWCLHSTEEFSFLPATSFTVSLYLHHLLDNSIYSVFYAINWVHKLAGFQNCNPCDKFLVKSIVEASSRVPRKPARKAEPITPEILGLILQHYRESNNLLALISGLSVCLLAYAGFFRISELLSIRRTNIVTEDLYHKIFIEVSKTGKYREGFWVYIAKTGNSACPYAYLVKYLEAARPFLHFLRTSFSDPYYTVRQEFEGECLVFCCD